jgi:hypothetical protein
MSSSNETARIRALELSAKFSDLGEDAGISVARAELFFDFLISDAESPFELLSARRQSGKAAGQSPEGPEDDEFPGSKA